MTVSSDNRAIEPPAGDGGPDVLRARLFIDGAWVDGAAGTRPVLDKYSGKPIGTVDQASREQVGAAVMAARRSFERTVLDPQQRYTLLMKTATLLEQHRAELAALITAEGGMPIADATSFDEALDAVNATPFGLAAGLFTSDLTRAMTAARRIQVGVVHLNEAASSRADLMPFAGVKQSGVGREGPKYAMHEMTEERLITISLS